jgi:hypothetical protein
MSAYTVTTSDIDPNGEPFLIIVENDEHQTVAEMTAMSPDHADMVADTLALLLRKLRPERSVLLDSKHLTPRVAAA